MPGSGRMIRPQPVIGHDRFLSRVEWDCRDSAEAEIIVGLFPCNVRNSIGFHFRANATERGLAGNADDDDIWDLAIRMIALSDGVGSVIGLHELLREWNIGAHEAIKVSVVSDLRHGEDTLVRARGRCQGFSWVTGRAQIRMAACLAPPPEYNPFDYVSLILWGSSDRFWLACFLPSTPHMLPPILAYYFPLIQPFCPAHYFRAGGTIQELSGIRCKSVGTDRRPGGRSREPAEFNPALEARPPAMRHVSRSNLDD